MPDKEQRVQVTTLLLFALFAGVRPAELVDTSLSTKEKKVIQDAFWRQTNLWDDPQNSDYNDAETNPFERSKSLYWENVELRKMVKDNGRTKLAIWVRCAFHKGVDRKPVPYISTATYARLRC